jgi:AcrR family transcriptional regulator
VSRAESPDRLIDAAIRLGVQHGAGSMSLQAIATTAGMSKALVLYHFGDKSAMLGQVTERLGSRIAARMTAAAGAPEALAAWRALARAEVEAGEVALLAGLSQERGVRAEATGLARAQREEAATRLAGAVMTAVRLEPRVPLPFLGRVILRHLDGLAVAAAQQAFGTTELEAELDAFAIALLGLGR